MKIKIGKVGADGPPEFPQSSSLKSPLFSDLPYSDPTMVTIEEEATYAFYTVCPAEVDHTYIGDSAVELHLSPSGNFDGTLPKLVIPLTHDEALLLALSLLDPLVTPSTVRVRKVTT